MDQGMEREEDTAEFTLWTPLVASLWNASAVIGSCHIASSKRMSCMLKLRYSARHIQASDSTVGCSRTGQMAHSPHHCMLYICHSYCGHDVLKFGLGETAEEFGAWIVAEEGQTHLLLCCQSTLGEEFASGLTEEVWEWRKPVEGRPR
ncbi:hypothetical protein E2C01_024629 [Portunus trituberculatus]|uniref:Uncharacterized protein n=1 Tax=Portunus trituberculatus TaxID=210409 RepID=A0A5B7EEA7_PORTR|nr:hypothetical protein [Portunus trituberculatus]